MRTAFAYTTARILIFAVAVIALHLAGVGGIMLFVLALVISALLSYILLNKQRQIMADRINGRLSKVGSKTTSRVAEFRERLEAGAAAEDAETEDGEPAAELPQTADEPAR